MKKNLVFLAILTIIFYVGCATGAKKTGQEPLHSENGGGFTIWKIPIFGFGSWGDDDNGVADIIVHKYDYTAQPPAIAPGAPPPPPTAPPPVSYPTVYDSAWDDPSLVIFCNKSYRRIRIRIDNQTKIILEPYGATADIHLGLGRHRINVEIEKPTAAHGLWLIKRNSTLDVRPEGRSQIFYIYE